MNAALFRKELRDLLPWGVLALALALSNVAELLLAQIDLAPLGRTFALLNEYTFVIYWFVAFAIGTGLAIREHDDRTLAFLDGLPVTRSRVFLVKCTVMALLVLIGPLLEVAAIGVFHLLSRGSLDQDLHPALLVQALALQALLLLNGLMVGAAFGRLRSLTWAAAGLAAAALILFMQRVPRAAVLNPLSLLDWQWTSAGIVVDGQTVGTQLAATALAGLVAWRGFVGAGKARRSINLSGPLASAAVVAATVVSIVAVIVMVMLPMEM
jgi:ABC-type transport system involved in multi-copper enzyme maturation permease subunit